MTKVKIRSLNIERESNVPMVSIWGDMFSGSQQPLSISGELIDPDNELSALPVFTNDGNGLTVNKYNILDQERKILLIGLFITNIMSVAGNNTTKEFQADSYYDYEGEICDFLSKIRKQITCG